MPDKPDIRDPAAMKRLADEARALPDRRLAIIYHDYPKVAEFHSKYAMGSKMAPSCLLCGKVEPLVITHAELPDIGVCAQCRDAARRSTPSTSAEALSDADKGASKLVDDCLFNEGHDGLDDEEIIEVCWLAHRQAATITALQSRLAVAEGRIKAYEKLERSLDERTERYLEKWGNAETRLIAAKTDTKTFEDIALELIRRADLATAEAAVVVEALRVLYGHAELRMAQDITSGERLSLDNALAIIKDPTSAAQAWIKARDGLRAEVDVLKRGMDMAGTAYAGIVSGLEKRAETAERSLARIREALVSKPLCLVCGKSSPCMLKSDLKPGDPGTPCTFDNPLVEPMAELEAERDLFKDFCQRAMEHGVNGAEYYSAMKAGDLGDEIKTALRTAEPGSA